MPPSADGHLQEKILRAASRLWRARGERGLTLRAVARAAGTTTPTLYKRFRNKEALRAALAIRFRDEMNVEIYSAPNVAGVYRGYLHYAEMNPNEYELLRMSFEKFLSPRSPQPGRAWFLRRMQEQFGGTAEQYRRIFNAIFLMCTGAATVLSSASDPEVREVVRKNCLDACDKLMENVAIFRTQAIPGARESKDQSRQFS